MDYCRDFKIGNFFLYAKLALCFQVSQETLKHRNLNIEMKLTVWNLLCISIILLTNGTEAAEEKIFTHLEGMMKLLQLEADLIGNLSSYADELEAKLKTLKSFIPKMQAESNRALNQMENYVSNPINAFSLIRRMHEDWHDWKMFMEISVGQSFLTSFYKTRPEFPDKAALNEICSSMFRLQKFYNMTTKDLTRGIINGKQYDTNLNALDTYAMGKYLTKVDRDGASEWFMATSEWLKEHTLQTPIAEEREKLLLLFAQAISDYEFHSIALSIFDHALLLANNSADPTMLSKRNRIAELARGEVKEQPKRKNEPTEFEIGCRGQFVQQSNLNCLYKTGPAFLRLARIKMEVLATDPLVVLFHDVLTSTEIEEMRQIARPNLERSLVMKYGVPVRLNIRISLGAWVRQKYNNLTMRIERRIMDMVDLELKDSEFYYVISYDAGGQYGAHHDYFSTANDDNRIATVVFYMSDVEQGGATVFPTLKQTVEAKPGNALFWYNLRHDGTCDKRTLHGGCPVLVGTKWIFTQWIRERPNIFRRRCRRLQPSRA